MKIDKLLHALVSYGAVLTFSLVMPLAWAVALTLVAGALKEWYDYTKPLNHAADWLDFAADAMGAGLAAAVLWGASL